MSRFYICSFLFILEDGEERRFMEEVSFEMTLKVCHTTCDVFSDKKLNLNLIKILDPTANLQDV